MAISASSAPLFPAAARASMPAACTSLPAAAPLPAAPAAPATATVAAWRPEHIHPALWRGSQMSHHRDQCVDTGYAALSHELPGGGWPTGSLIELMPSQPGIGEIRLLRPALKHLQKQRGVVLVQPPFPPNTACYDAWKLDPRQMLWIVPERPMDALWATEQILKNGSCAVVLCWQQVIRPESLRRLHLAAQGSNTLFFMLRPASAAQNASPAPLRITLQPASDGVILRIVKRRGPVSEHALHLKLDAAAPSFPPLFPYAPLDRRTPASTVARHPVSPLVA
jgi:protein ImuA